MKNIEPKSVDSRTAGAILTAGELAGLSWKLDIEALQTYLDSKPEEKGFIYRDYCEAAIEFARKINK